MADLYRVNEIYYTLHGEGVRYGIPHVFVRFTGCNLACPFCDTEMESGVDMTAEQILIEAMTRGCGCRNVMFCGGEPLLQLDAELIDEFRMGGYFIAIETNGTRDVPPELLDVPHWITCSPKVAEHAIKLTAKVDELKYARAAGQGIPEPRLCADHYLVSPIFEGDRGDADNVHHCVQLVKDNPSWRLTVQHHKGHFGGIR